jgi:hypothetical protein
LPVQDHPVSLSHAQRCTFHLPELQFGVNGNASRFKPHFDQFDVLDAFSVIFRFFSLFPAERTFDICPN